MEKIQSVIDEVIKATPKKYKAIQKDCEYLLNKKERFCKATTQIQCGRCKFFSPNYSARLKLLAEKILEERNRSQKEKALIQEYYAKEIILIRQNAKREIDFYRTCGTSTRKDELWQMQ